VKQRKITEGGRGGEKVKNHCYKHLGEFQQPKLNFRKLKQPHFNYDMGCSTNG